LEKSIRYLKPKKFWVNAMPIYECSKCGRQVELPEGTYYCKVCGPIAVMVKRGASPKGDYVTIKNVHGMFVVGEYATASVSGLIDYLRLYGVPDDIIEEYLPKVKTMAHGEAIKIPKHHSNSDKKTLCEVKRENLIITEVCGKPVRVVLLPDWTLLYVEFTSKEEMQTLRRALMREEDVRLVKVTEKRIYFERE